MSAWGNTAGKIEGWANEAFDKLEKKMETYISTNYFGTLDVICQ